MMNPLVDRDGEQMEDDSRPVNVRRIVFDTTSVVSIIVALSSFFSSRGDVRVLERQVSINTQVIAENVREQRDKDRYTTTNMATQTDIKRIEEKLDRLIERR